jgi:hypothetical protein
VVLRLIYQMFTKLLGWIVLHARSDATKEIEILVLRHQLAVLQRRTPRPRVSWTDRALIAALARLLPTPRRLGLLVTPSTILRWHRQLVARRGSTRPARPGRPANPAGLRAMVILCVPKTMTRSSTSASAASRPTDLAVAVHPTQHDRCRGLPTRLATATGWDTVEDWVGAQLSSRWPPSFTGLR